MLILGVNASGPHDASACLARDGRILCLAEEERFSRSKHAMWQRPYRAVQWCLDSLGVELADVDFIATSWDVEIAGTGGEPRFSVDVGAPNAPPPSLAPLFERFVRGGQCVPPTVYVSHHLAHAASAYRCSGFGDAAVLVVDGEGDGVSTTIAVAKNGEIKPVELLPPSSSLGHYYAALTSYLGFGAFGEGKVMGLAAYAAGSDGTGDFVLDGCSYACAIPEAHADSDVKAMQAAWVERLEARYARPALPMAPVWHGGGGEAFAWAAGVAAQGQAELERVMCHLATVATAGAGAPYLALAGGVALNCSANGRISSLPDVKDLFVQPMAGDAGTAIGAALEAGFRVEGWAPYRMRDVYLGPSFSNGEIRATLDRFGAPFRTPDDVVAHTAELLSRGAVVGWFQGAMEGGPRALGHRSILASPVSESARDHVNDVKQRERWRPLAPVMRADRTCDVFGRDLESPFMIVRHDLQPGMLERAPAVVHVDGSTRVQTVDPDLEPRYAELLSSFEDLTGVSCLINTSFNDESEPIVCTPRDAVRTFYGTAIDALVIGDCVLEKVHVGRDSQP